ncbi:MAG: type IV toxin-antitoxin system AbiEi family antitoxin domain-containing protein [Sphingomonas sp.]
MPEGLLVDAAWMQAHGYSSALRSQYVRSGWLDSPTRGVYRRSRTPLTWQQVAISLQTLLDRPLTVGGRTALEQLGYAHYLSAEVREVHLYGPTHPPTWLPGLPLDVTFRWHNSQRLFPEDERTLNMEPSPAMVSVGGHVTPSIRYSSKERAILELLDELPAMRASHQVDVLMEGLSDLSPRRMQTLLEHCASVKVKRLFLFFADRHRHAWRSRLDTSRVDLGSGKRVLVKGGKLDPRYSITCRPILKACELHGLPGHLSAAKSRFSFAFFPSWPGRTPSP